MLFQVFIAKYSYDPEQYSPNENPDVELALTAGDYLFVYGEMDEVRRKPSTTIRRPIASCCLPHKINEATIVWRFTVYY